MGSSINPRGLIPSEPKRRRRANNSEEQALAEASVEGFRQALGPFVVAAEVTRMATVFTNALEPGRPIIFVNDSFVKLTGYAREEAIGQPIAFLAASSKPETLEELDLHFDGGVDILDLECRRRDGGFLWVAMCAYPVHDEQGMVVQHCVSFVDLSTRMKRIRRERNALHALYQHTPDFIAITEGPDHRFSFANAAYQELVGPRDHLGLTIEEALPELAGQLALSERDKVYATGRRSLYEAMPVRIQRVAGADLELRYLNIIHQPIRDADGMVTGIFCEGHDVTQQREAAERMQSLQAELIHLSRISAMGTMAATLAHELTQPLTAIANHVAICSHLNDAGSQSGKQLGQSLEAIAASAHRGGEIIRRLRDMTMRRPPPHERFHLKGLVQESIALVGASDCAGIAIEDRTDPSIELVADRIQVQQVLINLIRNACEAIGSGGGKVTVLSGGEDGKIVVSVTDTGEGVSPEAARTLFEWSDSAKPEGSGIGLSISRTIIEAHEGAIWLAENGPGGACFRFSLPMATDAGAAEAPSRH